MSNCSTPCDLTNHASLVSAQLCARCHQVLRIKTPALAPYSATPRSGVDQEGFTLLELMITLMVFSIAMAGLSRAFLCNLRANEQSRLRTDAMIAAQQTMDDLRFQVPSAMPQTGTSSPVIINVDNKAFSVAVSYCQNEDFCISSNSRHVTVRVTRNGTELYATETVFTQLD